MQRKGFTLVELLIVVTLLTLVTILGLGSYITSQKKGRDTRKKNDLHQLQTALQLYYNDFQHYPSAGAGKTIAGCGVAGDQVCTDDFSAGSPTSIYVKVMPDDFNYYSDGDQGYLLETILENQDDAGSQATQDYCSPATRGYYSGSPESYYFFVCD